MPALTGTIRSDPVRAALAAVAGYGVSGCRRELPRVPFDEPTWRAFLAQVDEQRLTGLLATTLLDRHFPATEAQVEAVVALDDVAAATSLRLERLLLDVTGLLAENGIDLRVLKGPAVAHLDYPDPALRCFRDIDLLVRAGDFERTVVLLETVGGERPFPELQHGFDRRFGKGTVIAMPGGFTIDLHRTFVAGPLGITIDTDGLFATATPFVLGDRQLLALGHEERAIHTCIHAALSRPARLHSLRDVVQSISRQQLEVERVLQLAHAWHAQAVVARAVNDAWQIFDVSSAVPLSTWAGRYRTKPEDERMIQAYVGGDQSYARMAIATLRVIPSPRDKMAYAGAHLFPRRESLAARGSGWFEYLRRGASHWRAGSS